MYKFLFLLGLVCSVKSEEVRHKYVDPFAVLDRQLSNSLAYLYLWPWSKLMREMAALDTDEKWNEEPQFISSPDRFEVILNVKRFEPDELRIKVKNRYIIVEGKHKERSDDKQFIANRFVQNFVLPIGSKSEEVKAVLKENGVLTIYAPRHELPPPPPERNVPVILELIEKTEKNEPEKKIENSTEKEHTTVKDASIPTSSTSPTKLLDLVEETTHIGKIRKKELKIASKISKDNEVTKGDHGNGLDYDLIEPE